MAKTLVPTGPLVLGLDDTIERRWGRKIAARGIYRDPVRSSRGHFVKVSGLRWLSLMLLAPIPWAGRVWHSLSHAAVRPSERYYRGYGRRHRLLTERARQVLRTVQRWQPTRPLVVVADSGFAALELLAAVTNHALSVVTRLRLDAALYEPAPHGPPAAGAAAQERPALADAGAGAHRSEYLLAAANGAAVVRRSRPRCRDHLGHGGLVPQWNASRGPSLVLIRDPAERFKTQALLCTNPQTAAADIVHWFVRRWQLEVTFEEVRPTSVWKHSASGPNRPSPEPPPYSWACFLS